ncbi:hypothetical protein Tco_0156205 [Tanacetum coccineum]
MTDSIQLYDVKVVVRSALKLLPKIKCLLSSNPNRLNLFRRTVFGPRLDLPSHYNDNHLMHYVLQHQSKEDKNCIARHLVTLVENLDAWNDYPWGEYMWSKFYEMTVNIVYEYRQHHLDEEKKNPNYNATYNLYGFAWAFKIWILESYPNGLKRIMAYLVVLPGQTLQRLNLDPIPTEKIQAWFESSIPLFNGIVDDDWKGCGDDSVLVSKDNSVDEDCNVCEDASACLSKDNVVNQKSVGNNDQVHEERISNLERILKEKHLNDDGAENTKPNMIPNHSDDIPSCSVLDLNSNQTGVDQELGGAANDPMSICSRPDMHNAEVGFDGMAIDKPNQMNDYNCSQPIHASVDAPIQACAYASDHPELDVLQHEAYADEFRDDYMSVLNDEEIIPNVSLDDMKFQHEEDNFPVKDTPLEHQPVDELIDAQKDSMNFVARKCQADYKPPLETVFAANIRSKKKKCGLQKKYVLRSVQERKKKLAMALGSPYGQLGTTTPAPPKTRSMTSIGDTIVAPEFEVEISGQPKIRSLNELLTLQVFVENLSRPDGCKKDKVTVLDEISEFLKMQDPPEYRFPWGFRDITVDRIFWLQLACLDLAKKGWLGDSVRNRRPWWRNMKTNLPQQLTSYLNEHGVLASKGISVERYEIKYAFPNVVRQADESGDYGVWVCIFLYRLSHKQPLAFKDPIQTVLAYRETMLQYFWNHKFAAPKAVLMDEGFGVPPDTLDPTIVKISYLVSRQGNWYVSVFTMSSETWNQVANNRLP